MLWFGTGNGVTQFDGTTWSSFDSLDGLAGNTVRGIFEDATGFLWFGTDKGLVRYQKSKAVPNAPKLTVQIDRDYTSLSALPAITTGQRVTFKFGVIDLRTRAESRQYRHVLAAGKSTAEEFDQAIDRSADGSSARSSASGHAVEPSALLVGATGDPKSQIFQPFQQLEAGLKKGGTGLGWALTRRQVELMGGEVKLESTLGKGSRFYFEIELPPARGRLETLEARETREVVRLAAGSRVNALVVDDNQNNRDMLSQLLRGIGCQVRLAENAAEAFDRVKEEVPDIIFMDVRMPKMNGAEATRRIIAEHGPDKIKIVAITASVLEHEKAGHMKAGFHSFLAKPFRFPEVCASLKQFLKVEFEYADEPAGAAAAAEEMDASRCAIPRAVWETLKEAADRYSLTGLKKAMEPLENNGDSARQAAEYLKRLIHAGDLDRVSAFLEEVKQKGGVV